MPPDALGSIRTSLARWQPLDLNNPAQVLPLGIAALDAALPGGGLALGGVTELQVGSASGVATSFALAACRAAQLGCRDVSGRDVSGRGQGNSERQASVRGQPESRAWCAFIDPSASLFAPGVTRLGVDLSRLLVMRPPADAIDRVAVRIAEANLMALLVIDLRGSILPRSINEHSWQRTVRRLSLAIKSSLSSVLLITQAEQFQSLPLPTFQRLELTRKSQASFELKVAKERTGRISAPRLLPCSIFDLSSFDPSTVTSRHAVDSRDVSDMNSHWEPGLTALARKVS